MIEFRLPQLTMGTSVATVANWLKNEGDSVSAGEALVEVDADKVTMELECPVDGVLAKICVPQGEEIEVQDVLALIDETA